VIAGIRLGIYSRDDSEEEDTDSAAGPRAYWYGERLRFLGKLREPRNFGNPGAWDYRGYLAGHDITALGSARGDRVEVLTGFAGNRWGRWRSRMRRSVLAKVHALWSTRQAALMDAMLIGDTTYIDHETRIAFQRTGVYHILVVSGMNVCILAFVVFWWLRRLRVSELACSAVTLALSAGYAYLCDGGAPIVRATLMLAIYLVTRLVHRERGLLNAVSISALLLLAADRVRSSTQASS
jgi:competence protein ComEC